MENLVTYARRGSVGRIVIEDGALNVMSLEMLTALDSAFNQAEQDKSPVVLSASGKVFSAGFDLKTFSHGTAAEIHAMLKAGAELALRILQFRWPVISACHGHSYPMGAFLIMASDFRLAAEGSYKIGMNEVAIGLTVPRFAIELARQRLTPAYFHRCVDLGEMLRPVEALTAGFFDMLVPMTELDDSAERAASAIGRIDLSAHYSTKLRTREPAISAMREAIDADITLEYAEARVAARTAAA